MSTSVIPTQKRYRDWKAPVLSKESMEPLAIINGIGPMEGFNKVMSVADEAETGYVTLSHNMSAMSPQYKYLMDRVQKKLYIGGVLVTPDGILTLIEEPVSLGFAPEDMTQFMDIVNGENFHYKELLIVASHAYVEDDGADSHSTYLRAIPNTTDTSLKATIGWEDRSSTGGNKHYISKGKGMFSWMAHPLVTANVDESIDIIIGLCIYNSETSDIINPYGYKWPLPLNMTDALWEEMVVGLPRNYKLKLHSNSAPNDNRWVLRNMTPGDTLEIYCPALTGATYNTNRDVMSIWPSEASFIANNKPLVQVLFNNIHYPLVLKVSRLNGNTWVAELFKQGVSGGLPLFKYVLAEYHLGDVVKVNVIDSSMISDGTVEDILPPTNTLTLHTVFTFGNQGSGVQTRNTLDMWLTSESVVASDLSIPVTGTYSTSADEGKSFSQIFGMLTGSKKSGSVHIDDLRDDDYEPRPYPMVVGAISPAKDNSYMYVVGPPDNVVGPPPSGDIVANQITVFAAVGPSADEHGNLTLSMWMGSEFPVESDVSGSILVAFVYASSSGQSSITSLEVPLEIPKGKLMSLTRNMEHLGLSGQFAFELKSLTPDADSRYDYKWINVVNY